jgi:NAD(P)-dependent dehydrogenase (short-subunit alcohol dehydrogenase family)
MRKEMADLQGRVAIVTGAGSGIGLQISRRFAEEGLSVVASDVSEEGLTRAEEVEGVFTVKADVSSADDVEGMIGTAIERHGRLDVLVNNAGILDRFLPAAETPDELWDRVLRVNLTGPFLATKHAIRRCSRVEVVSSSTSLPLAVLGEAPREQPTPPLSTA